MTEIVMVPASSGPVMVADDGEVLVAQASGPQIITAGIGAGGATGAKGDPGSPGEGYATRSAMAARAAPALLDDVYLTEKGREGKFVVEAASSWTAAIAADNLQGLFVISTADATKVYVRKFTGPPHVNWWGAKGDYNGTTGTDNATIFVAAMTAIQALAIQMPDVGSVWYLNRSLSLKDGGRYYTTAPFNIITSLEYVDFEGAEIVIPANTFGIVINDDTTNVEATRASGPFPRFCVLNKPKVKGHNGTDRTKHGIWMRSTAYIKDASVIGVSGDGIRIGNSNGHTAGNQNGWRLDNPFCQKNGGDGIHAEGADASAGACINYDVDSNGRFGIVDLSAAGNKWNGQAAANGILLGGVNTVPAYVWYGGHNWAIIVGQEANTTVTPSSARPDVWLDVGVFASGDPAVPTWTSGIVMEAGGSVKTVGGTGTVQFDRPYFETGQYSPFQLNSTTIIRDPVAPIGIGGIVEYPNNGTLRNLSGYTVANTDATGTSSIQIGGYGIGGVNFFANMDDSLGHSWVMRADGGYWRIHDNQALQPLIATPLPGSGINFGRSTDQPGTAFFYQLAIGYPNGGRIFDCNSAAPVSGNHAQGEVVFNNAAVSGGFVGWVCTAAGTPGTWKTFGAIS